MVESPAFPARDDDDARERDDGRDDDGSLACEVACADCVWKGCAE